MNSAKRLSLPSFCVLIIGCLIIGAGCRGEERIPVSGSVTIDGMPVETGNVRFKSDHGPIVVVAIQDGQYNTATSQSRGLLAGQYRVDVQAYRYIANHDGALIPDGVRPQELLLEHSEQVLVQTGGELTRNFQLSHSAID